MVAPFVAFHLRKPHRHRACERGRTCEAPHPFSGDVAYFPSLPLQFPGEMAAAVKASPERSTAQPSAESSRHTILDENLLASPSGVDSIQYVAEAVPAGTRMDPRSTPPSQRDGVTEVQTFWLVTRWLGVLWMPVTPSATPAPGPVGAVSQLQVRMLVIWNTTSLDVGLLSVSGTWIVLKPPQPF